MEEREEEEREEEKEEEEKVQEKIEEKSNDPLVAGVMTEVKLESGTVLMEDRGVMMEENGGYIKISRV